MPAWLTHCLSHFSDTKNLVMWSDSRPSLPAESFGGPDRFSKEMGGFRHLIDVHRGYPITEAQRQRFVDLFIKAADKAGLPADDAFRSALKSHVDFGSQVATQNSNTTTEAELHPLREVPKWHW